MTTQECLNRLDARRRDVGMSIAVLAKRSGVSKPTLQRLLSGKQKSASFEHVVAISSALGMAVDLAPRRSVGEFRKENALEKAKQVVRMVQATSALEGQAIASVEKLNDLIDRAADSLLGGSRRRLWTD